MRAWIGKSMVAIGVAHTAFGVVIFGDLLWPAFSEGMFNTVNLAAPAGRRVAFWYMFMGFVVLLLGMLMDWVERQGMRLPVSLGWGLGVLALVGALMMPASGFWLLLIPVVGIFAGARQHAAQTKAGEV